MADERHLDGLDPCALWEAEAVRLDTYLAALADHDPAWEVPSRCADWSARDVLAHLLAEQDYFAACLAGTVGELMAELGARGAVDITTFNAIGIADQAGKPPSQLLAEWRAADAANRDGFRERGDGTVDSSIGEYPARWQAFHLASELATHADDVHLPDPHTDERLAWRVPFSRFSLGESKEDLTIEAAAGGRTRVSGPGLDVELDGPTFVEAVAGRSDDPALAPLSTSP
jgi:uncharacterized protein (TIGR03083 family)